MKPWTILLLASLILPGTALADTPAENPPFLAAATRPDRHAVPLAIIDSGADYNHSMIRGSLYTNPNEREGAVDLDGNGFAGDVHGWDFGDNDAHPYDYVAPETSAPSCNPHTDGWGCITDQIVHGIGEVINLIRPGAAGHGTHCAGIAARSSGRSGLILPLRIKYASPEWLVQVDEAVEYAASRGARVVSMSFGVYESEMKLEDFVRMFRLEELMAQHRDMVFVVAAGNENVDMKRESKGILPGTFGLDNLILVGAVDSQGKLASFSNVGEGVVDVYAPGVDIVSAWPGGADATRVLSGTSMATPFVAGLAARVAAADPSLSGAAIKERVLSHATPRELVFTKNDTKTSSVLPLGTTETFSAPVLLERDVDGFGSP